MNIHTIHGRLARDPELTRDNDPKYDRCKFTVAVDRRYGDETDFFDCTIFGKRAAVIDKFFRKGSEIAVTGEGQIRTYEDRNGVKRKSYSIVVGEFDFCGSKGDNTSSEPTSSEPPQTEAAPDEQVPDGFTQVEEDIPF